MNNRKKIHIGFDCEFNREKLICWSLYIYETGDIFFFEEYKSIKETINLIGLDVDKHIFIFIGHYNIAEIVTLKWYEEIKLLCDKVYTIDGKSIIVSTGNIQFYDTKILTKSSLVESIIDVVDQNWKKALTKDELSNIDIVWQNNKEKVKQYNIDDSKYTVMLFMEIKKFLEKYNISIYQDDADKIYFQLFMKNVKDFSYNNSLCNNIIEDDLSFSLRNEVFDLHHSVKNIKAKYYLIYLKREIIHALSYLYSSNVRFDTYMLSYEDNGWEKYLNKPSFYKVEFEHRSNVKICIIPVKSKHNNKTIYPTIGVAWITNLELKVALSSKKIKSIKVLKYSIFVDYDKKNISKDNLFSSVLGDVLNFDNRNRNINKIASNIFLDYLYYEVMRTSNDKRIYDYSLLKKYSAYTPRLFNNTILGMCVGYVRSIINSFLNYIESNTNYKIIICDHGKIIISCNLYENIYFDGFMNSLTKSSNNPLLKGILYGNFVIKYIGHNICVLNNNTYKIYNQNSYNNFVSSNWSFQDNRILSNQPYKFSKRIFPDIIECMNIGLSVYKLIYKNSTANIDFINERIINGLYSIYPMHNISQYNIYYSFYKNFLSNIFCNFNNRRSFNYYIVKRNIFVIVISIIHIFFIYLFIQFIVKIIMYFIDIKYKTNFFPEFWNKSLFLNKLAIIIVIIYILIRAFNRIIHLLF